MTDRSRTVGSRLPGRDLRLERDLLAQVDAAAPVPLGYGFGDLVAARLALGDRRHGHGYVSRTVDDLLAEAVEEAEDLPAWALLAYQQAVRHGADQSTLDTLRQSIVEAGVAAATAHVQLTRAAGVWKRAEL